MKTFLSIAVALFLSIPLEAQWADAEDYFSKDHTKRNFITIGYGEGRTQWYSRTEGYKLYDQRGKKVLSGDHNLTAATDYQSYQIGVAAPVGRLRLGMGIEFDEFSIYQIHVEDPSVVEPVSMIDNFRFDKVHLTLEYPTLWIPNSSIHLDLFLKGGYYAFSKINSFNLFGKGSGKTFFASIGPILAVQAYKRAHVYFRPRLGYRHFNNSDQDSMGAIYHDLFSYGAMVGLRYRLL